MEYRSLKFLEELQSLEKQQAYLGRRLARGLKAARHGLT